MKFDSLPSQCLVDQSLEIRLRGLAPGERVALQLCSRFGHEVLQSEAFFVADANGTVDATRQSPVAGSYHGVDAMGLFWSRAPVPPERVGGIAGLSDDPLTATLRAVRGNDEASTAASIRRVYVGDGVRQREVRERGLVGKLFEPAGTGPHPAVLVLGGSNGSLAWSQEMAALLASHGFAALALAYFAADGLPPTLDRIPLEYFGTALEWLAQQPGVMADRIGTVGVSRGGELALLLGAHFPAIGCVIGYVPSGIVWPAYPASGHGAWTLGGQEIAFASTLTHAQWDEAVARGLAREDSFDWYLIPLRDQALLEQTSIRVENINGPVLLISGEADGLWPSTDLADFALQRLLEKRFPHRAEHLSYPRAGHSIAWPNAPTTMTRSTHAISGETMDMGGTPEGNARARSASWPRMLAFLRDALQR
ncbi:acyl-CoA thioesterase/bile acid-CoA:amino acid N-acyltransferase family protein [Variovorax paradoxus]|uniref:acyl-CoA thioesterase/bile acid-CoA:amino acid N-acyltransferase family protein n=1 Tax=Variovorax paradoxus TaxID=34073 RepID=UPI001931C036|nr:acyl-CoA thioesterase/BAAT N-terminal domain-containing protein [Variovorax paradoxus]